MQVYQIAQKACDYLLITKKKMLETDKEGKKERVDKEKR